MIARPFHQEMLAALRAPPASPALWSIEAMMKYARFTRMTQPLLALSLLVSLVFNVLAMLDIDAFIATWRAANRPRYRQQVEMFASSHEAHKHRPVVLFLGDSLTNRWAWHEFLTDLTPAVVLNRGLSGDTVERLLNRLEPTVPPNAQIQRAFVMIGINDIQKRHFHLPTFIAQYGKLVDRLLTIVASDKICVMSILPARWKTISNEVIQTTNAQLGRLTQEKGLCYIDLYQQFVDATGQLAAPLTNDGVHLTVEGYRRWMVAITPYLSPRQDFEPVALGVSGSRRHGGEHD